MKPEPTDRREWLESRRLGLGGSDVAGILGLSPWSSAFDVWASKVAEMPDRDSEAMQRGRYLERAVLDWYEDETGLALRRDVGLTVHPDEPWIRGTVDAVAPGRIVEAKTSRSADGWGDPGTDRVPLYYLVQCVWYMMLHGLDAADVAVFFTVADQFARYTIHRDPKVEERIVEQAREWWRRHVVGEEPPPISGTAASGAWLAQRYPDSSGQLREATAEEVELIQQLVEAKAACKAADAHRKTLEARLKDAIGEDEGVTAPGLRSTWKPQTRRSVDAKALRAEHPELAEQFTRESTFRVLRTHQEK